MEFLDQDIAGGRRQKELLEDARQVDTAGEAALGHQIFRFREEETGCDLISIMLPDLFRPMTDDEKKCCFPLEKRPSLLFVMEGGLSGFTFERLEESMSQEQLGEMGEYIKNTVKKAQPTNLFYQEGQFVLQEGEAFWFDFKSYTLEEPVYNVMFLVYLRKRVYLGNLYCKFDLYRQWLPTAEAIIGSIRVKDGKTVKNSNNIL